MFWSNWSVMEIASSGASAWILISGLCVAVSEKIVFGTDSSVGKTGLSSPETACLFPEL